MKYLVLFLISLISFTLYAADVSKTANRKIASTVNIEKARLAIVKIMEVKAVIDAYKKQGYKCQDTAITILTEDEFSAQKACTIRTNRFESSVELVIKGSHDNNSNFIITSIEFVRAG